MQSDLNKSSRYLRYYASIYCKYVSENANFFWISTALAYELFGARYNDKKGAEP